MKIKKIVLLLIAVLMLFATSSLAASEGISLEGDNTAKTDETKTVSIKITQEKEIGLVEGKIEKSGNIEIVSVKGKNNWSLTYNENTGVFNIFNASGAKTAEIMDIEYKAGKEKGKGSIKISNINLLTIDYQEIPSNVIEKEITVTENDKTPTEGDKKPTENDKTPTEGDKKPTEKTISKIEITKAPTKTTYTEGEKFNKTGMVVKAKYSDGTSKEITNYTYSPNGILKTADKSITITYTENGVTKTVGQKITVKSSTTTKPIPQTGTTNTLICIIAVIAIVSLVLKRLYNRYRGI